MLDLTFQLPGAGSAVSRENLTSLEMDSFLYVSKLFIITNMLIKLYGIECVQ